MKWITQTTARGIVKAPSSKSMMQRAVAAGVLAKTPTLIINPSHSKDSKAALRIAKSLGVGIDGSADRITLTPGQHPIPEKPLLNCGESGLSLRLFCAIASTFDREITITGEGSLARRPLEMIEAPLNTLGISCKTSKGRIPVSIRGPIKGGHLILDGTVTSQFLSGLLMSLPVVNAPDSSRPSIIKTPGLVSKPYVQMTLEVMNDFGINISSSPDLERFEIPGNQTYQGREYTVEGDWSSAAFMLVAGALSGPVCVTNLNSHSLQADKAILNALDQCGARIKYDSDKITVSGGTLNPFNIDATHCPDLFPILTTLATACHGTSSIRGLHRLIHKESDRAKALISEFSKLGASIRTEGDRLLVDHSDLSCAVVHSHNDHRISMCLAIVALRTSGGVKIENWKVIDKSYPEFFTEFKALETSS